MEIMTEVHIALETGSARKAGGVPSSHVTNRVRTVADWAAEISKFVDGEKDKVLDLARTVHLAKTSLYRGQWSAQRDLVRAELCHLALELKELRGPLPSVNRLFPDRSSLPTGSTNN